MKQLLIFTLLIGPLAIGMALASMEFSFAAAQQTPPRAANDDSTSKLLATLKSLVIRFDTDTDRSLSPQEQAELLKHVEQTYDQRWAERAKQWMKAADTSGDGTISESEWRQYRATLAQRAKAMAAAQPAERSRQKDNVTTQAVGKPAQKREPREPARADSLECQ